MKNGIVLVVAVASILTGLDRYVQAAEDNLPIRHVIVYKQPGRFCGWPANNGAWSWDNEILVCFTNRQNWFLPAASTAANRGNWKDPKPFGPGTRITPRRPVQETSTLHIPISL
jgi:hypothetical protein